MKRKNQDSMGLMIDTMCNGVGGLVLVAILIVLVSMSESPSSAEGQMQRKQLENEVEALRIQEDLLRSENDRMSQNDSDLEADFAETISARELKEQLSLIERKKAAIKDMEERLEQIRLDSERAAVADPGQYVAEELKALNGLRNEVEQLEDQLARAKGNLEALKERYSELLSEVAEKKELKSRTLKTPVERRYSRYDFIYVRYGKFYTLADEDAFTPGNQFEILGRNEYAVRFEPKKNAGVSLDSRELRAFLEFSKRRGGTCMVGFYADSFGLYLPIKKMIDAYDLPLGIDFYTDATPPGFTTQGGTEIMGQGQ
ncbi:MAG: hypothetical protein CML13_02375 [Puniceicoccaceae bacterium]|nr:hypothetical protein [Puniceicoccaceae bacterium]|tara:strand:- start:360 stop:1304 length:945 start_codon:yes stop_codon:yes gene_type:complete